MIVLDASVAAAWIFPDEGAEYAERVLAVLHATGGAVPPIWPLEMANILLVAERRRRLSGAQTVQAARLLQQLPIRVVGGVPTGGIDALLAIGRRELLSAYDASYLELAMREGVPLATLDSRMRLAAENLGVSLA